MRATTLSDAPAGRPSDATVVKPHISTSLSVSQAEPGPVALLLLGWLAVAIGIAINNGRYAIAPMVLVVGGTIAVGVGVYASAGVGGAALAARLPLRLPKIALALVAVTVALAPFVVLTPAIWDPNHLSHPAAQTVSGVLASLSGFIAAATVLPEFGRCRRLAGRRWPFWVSAALMTAAGCLFIASMGEPTIDVYWLLQGSTDGLVHGADMYRQQWAESRALYVSHGLFDVYPYLPWTSVLLLPFRLLFGDVRYGLVVFLGVAAFMARRLGSGTRGLGSFVSRPVHYVPAVLVLLLAIFPKVTYSERQAWTEPLLVALLTGVVLAVDRGHLKWAIVCLALALASKQHIVLLLPVAAMWPRFGVRRTAVSAGAALLLVLPWIIAGPRDFWHDAVASNVGMGYRSDALCLATFVHKAFGFDPGFALTAVGIGVAYALAWRIRGTAFGFAAGAGLLVLALDVTNTQSFFNHYTLGMALVVLAVVIGSRQDVVVPVAAAPHGLDGLEVPEAKAPRELLVPGPGRWFSAWSRSGSADPIRGSAAG